MAAASVDYVLGYCDSWEEGKHPRDEGGKFAEQAVAAAKGAPGKEGVKHSESALEASRKAGESGLVGHHMAAKEAHHKAYIQHGVLGQKHRTQEGPNAEHAKAADLHKQAVKWHSGRTAAELKTPLTPEARPVGKFSETAEGKTLHGHSAGAMASAERAPGKEGHRYSKVAHEASQHAIESDKPEDHTWARDMHRAAASSHGQLAQTHANFAGPNGDHGAARHSHEWAAAAHTERLQKLWESGKPKGGAKNDSAGCSADDVLRACEEFDREHGGPKDDVLEGGESREAFEHNVRTEVNAGKPQKQAVAIAYSKQRGDEAGG